MFERSKSLSSRFISLGFCSICAIQTGCGEQGSQAGAGGAAGGGSAGAATAGVGVAGSGGLASGGNVGVGGTTGTAGAGGQLPAGPVSVGRVRAEYRENPLGIDVDKPRLEWQLTSTLKDEKQTAYQVLVATSAEQLAEDKGDLWDTGKVSSDQSIQLPYAGKPLTSRQRAFWKVRAWDKDGTSSAWSESAFWEMGLLAAGDWSAKWLSSATGLDAPGASWIWYPEGDPLTAAPEGVRLFRKVFTVATKPTSVLCTATADNDYELFVNGVSVGSGTEWNEQRVWNVTAQVVPGKNVLAARAHNVDSAAGFVASLGASFAGSAPLSITTDQTWKTSNAAEASVNGWQTANYDDSAWPAAKSLTAFGTGIWKHPGGGSPAYLRRVFDSTKTLKRARIYVTALGLYELWLNGERVGTDHLTPGWTDYNKRLQVQTYDVTSLIAKGKNALGAILADGWFTGKVGFRGRGQFFGAAPNRLQLQLELEADDGSVQTIVSGDQGWKSGNGPILAADLLDGETYDARLEEAWSEASFDDSSWPAAKVVTDATARKLVFDATDHVRAQQEIKPLTLKQQTPGVYIYDLGQNMVGWTRLRVTGSAGAKVQLRFAEVLNPDGSIYVTNLRYDMPGYAGAKATDTYVLRGGAEETYEPRFTTHGFRYVELTGDVNQLASAPSKDSVTGVVAYSHLEQTGELKTSSDVVNQLISNILWGQRGNFMSVPTDCPQRDERLGWMGDAQVFARTATLNMDVASFFTKWTRDVDDAQTAAGAFADTSPNPTFVGSGSPAWGDAGVIVPWTIYEAYGDLRILEEHFPAMARWVDYISASNPENLWKTSRGSDFGDWLSINADTDKELLASAFYAHSTDLVARSARLLGKTAQAAKYDALFAAIKAAFQAAYLAPDGKLKGDTQTAYALALRFDLLTRDQRAQAGQRLHDDVTARGHLSAGFIGVGHLLPALSAAGFDDTAYQLLNTDTFPSWLYSVKKGATTIWERWDGITESGDFQTPVMNSFNHYSFGAVGEWLYGTVGGIQLDSSVPAYKRFSIRPVPGGGITSARAALQTPYGAIVSDWKLANGSFSLSATIPVNTTAEIFMPSAMPVSIDGQSAKLDAAGAVELGSGTYSLSAALP